MSDNWIVQNLNSALNTWNEKLAEIWTLLTQSPESFKGGTIWSVITGINGALTAIGYGLLVLFFAAGIVKTCGSFTDMKKPEHLLVYGFLPGYHMNKEHWITMLMDGTVSEAKILDFLDMSYDLIDRS